MDSTDMDNETDFTDTDNEIDYDVFWIIDVSGSMVRPDKIDPINNMIHEVHRYLEGEIKKNGKGNFLINIMTFSDNTNWLIKNQALSEVATKEIQISGHESTETNIQKMFEELIKTLKPNSSITEYHYHKEGRFHLPIILVISDGLPTDDLKELYKSLDTLEIRNTVRIPVRVGIQRKYNILEKLSSLPDNEVLEVTDISAIRNTIIDRIDRVKVFPPKGCELFAQRLEKKVKVIEQIGKGGQGKVFRVQSIEDGQEYALKWYNTRSSRPQQQEILERLVRIGSPDIRFRWPRDVLENNDVLGFGYIMYLIEEGFSDLDYMFHEPSIPAYRILLRGSFEFANAFQFIHHRGMSYQDISAKNLFLDWKTGEIRIIDLDNVVFSDSPSTIKGTRGFMAPEIVTRKTKPTKQTDRFSLSMIIFLMILKKYRTEKNQTLETSKKSPNQQRQTLESFEFYTIIDYSEYKTICDELVQAKRYPSVLTSLFKTIFDVGIDRPYERPLESNWLETIALIQGLIFKCQECRSENFLNEAVSEPILEDFACWNCNRKPHLKSPYWLKFEGQNKIIILDDQLVLYNYQLPNTNLDVMSEPIAKFVLNNEHNLEMINMSSRDFKIHSSDNKVLSISKDKKVVISIGQKIGFGSNEDNDFAIVNQSS
jgi:eukaryotic-like serine/threonine-protein kinase